MNLDQSAESFMIFPACYGAFMIKQLRTTSAVLLLAGLATHTAAIASEQSYNQVSLRAEAHQEVAHDQMQEIGRASCRERV